MNVLKARRPTTSTIDLEALAFNFRSVKSFVGDQIKYMAVVKADAYGHCAIECSRRLSAEGIDWLGVALPEEGIELRKAGITKQILCLGGFWPDQEDLLLEYGLTPVIYQLEQARLLQYAVEQSGRLFNIHVKIDTGMGRIGVSFNEVSSFAEKIKEFTSLKVDGLMTHFAAADDLSQNEFTNNQIDKFETAVEIFKSFGHRPTFIDLANSPGAIAHPASRANMVRLGGILYGLGGDVLPKNIDKPELKPVLSLSTELAHIKRVAAGESLGYGRTFVTKRESLIATIPIGYSDGFPRSLSNIGSVIIRGKKLPIAGRISMDWTIIDVTDAPGAEIGDKVTIIGSDADETIRAEDIAVLTDTISYEITCGIDRRVPRVFIENEK